MIAGAPIKVVATLLGLFGNDNNKYRWISATLTQINSAQSFDSSVNIKLPNVDIDQRRWQVTSSAKLTGDDFAPKDLLRCPGH